MCQEIYHMMRTMNQDGLEFQLALQCAPLITGIKISNLLMVCGKREDAVQELLEGSDISCFCVMSSPKKTAFLLYREEELRQYLGRTDVRHLLKKLGYKDSSLDNVLPKFRKRYEAHMNGEQQFPHEMGLLLGYRLRMWLASWNIPAKSICIPDTGRCMRMFPQRSRSSCGTTRHARR